MTNLLIKLIKKLPSITIPREDGKPYLIRYYPLLRDWNLGNVFIHHFRSSDLDQEGGVLLLHNHPMKWAVSFIFTNGYFEERRHSSNSYIGKRFVKPLSFNFISSDVFHRVELLSGKEDEGVWTIFITGPRVKGGSWGFWNRMTNRFKDYKEQYPNKAVA